MKRCVAALLVLAVIAAAAALGTPPPAGAAGELKFYGPVGVSGPLARVMEGMVSDFNGIHPGIHVTPVFSGGYYETMTKLYKDYTDRFPQALTTRDQLRYAQAELSTHNGGEIQNMCSNDLQAALTGRKTPGAALRDAQQQADRLLSQYRKK